MTDLLKLSAYDYDLPEKKIAQFPHDPADECKMLYCKVWNNFFEMKDLIFKDILNLLSNKDVLFFNNSKVVKARIKANENTSFRFILPDGKASICNKCEIFFLKDLWNGEFEALVFPGKKFKKGRKININWYLFEVVDKTKDGRILRYLWESSVFDVFDKLWIMPLPPYVEYKKEKESAYQSVFAENAWSVAAPTASLHFTDKLLKELENKWIEMLYSTLHIWLGTFKTVDVDDIQNYDIHSEMVQVPLNIFKELWKLKLNDKKLVAVWTTATRIIESLPYLYKKCQKIKPEDYQKIKNDYFDDLVKNISLQEEEKFIPSGVLVNDGIISFETKLYIYPGFNYKLVDKLITNFHLPKSSLLMLVAAFMWYENMKKAYKHAIENDYRFFSFGDVMFVERTEKLEGISEDYPEDSRW